MLLCKPIVVKGIIKPDVHHCRVMMKRCNAEKCSIDLIEAPSVYVESSGGNPGVSYEKSNSERIFTKNKERTFISAQDENEQIYFIRK